MIALLTIREVADRLHICPRQVRRIIDSGKLPIVIIGPKTHRFRQDDVYRYMEENEISIKDPAYYEAKLNDTHYPGKLGYVYIFQISNDGPIKIGFSEFPEGRLSTLQQNMPYELFMVHYEDSDMRIELLTHNKLSPYKLRGEWYENNDNMRQYIEYIKEHGFRDALKHFWWDL